MLSIKPLLKARKIITEGIDYGCLSSAVHLNQFLWTSHAERGQGA